jgi:hypothetical protein
MLAMGVSFRYSSFTPTSPVNMSNEKDWAANLGYLVVALPPSHSQWFSLGMLDWDSTSIIFTKRSLMEFLKFVVSPRPLSASLTGADTQAQLWTPTLLIYKSFHVT